MLKLKTSLLFLAIMTLVLPLGAQEPLKHPMKWYTSPKGQFFYNKNQPVYFWISTSPSENSLKHRLKSESAPKYSNPMYFDTEGYNTLRSPSKVDTITKIPVMPKEDIRFEIQADGLAPVSIAKFTGAKKYEANNKVYYGRGLKIEINTTDQVSGVEAIYYSVNGAAYQQYKEAIDFQQEIDNCVLAYYSVDNVGNAETPKKVTFSVDVTGPETQKLFTGKVTNKNTLSPNAQIVLESKDNMSGLKQTYYVIDKNAPQAYTKPLPASLFIGGSHKLAYYAIDNVDNNNSDDQNAKSKEFKLDFFVDNLGPVVTHKIQGDLYQDRFAYVSSRSLIEFSATDNYSDVEKITYGIDNKANSNVYSAPFALNNRIGLQTINFSAIDGIGNISTSKSFDVFMDNASPNTGINFGKPQFFNRDTLFIKPNTQVSLFAKDQESGVLKTEYSINSGALSNYSKDFNLPNEGYYAIKFRSVDKVNNIEQDKQSFVYVDNHGPEVYVNFSIQKIRDQVKDGKSYPVYPTFTKVYIGATDTHVGTESIFYSLNNSALKNYASLNNISEVCMLTQQQFYTLKIVTTDKLGNESVKIVEFFASDK